MGTAIDILGDDGTLTRQAIDLAARLGYGPIRVFGPVQPFALPATAEWIAADSSQLSRGEAAFIALSDSQGRVEAIHGHAERRLVNLVHPAAAVNETASLAGNVFVDAFGFVGLAAELAVGVCLNSRSTVEHDNVIGEGVTFGTGATLCGRVEIGAHTFVGAGAVVRPKTSIAPHTTLGAGAVVVSDVTESGVYIGSPARRIER